MHIGHGCVDDSPHLLRMASRTVGGSVHLVQNSFDSAAPSA